MDERSIADIFATPPSRYRDDDMAKVVAEYRAKRAQYMNAASAPKEPKAKGTKTKVKVDIGDLDI